MYDFGIETYSEEGINPKIRIIYDSNLKNEASSEWMLMSDFVCGKIRSAEFYWVDRNIMKTYAIDLNEFIGYPLGAEIIGIEFDFTNSISNKTLLLDEIGFMN